MNFKEKTGSVNFLVPISTISNEIGSNKSVIAHLATKKEAGNDQPWGEFTINWTIAVSRVQKMKEVKHEEPFDKDAYQIVCEDNDSCNSESQVTCPSCKAVNASKDPVCVGCNKTFDDEC